MHFLDELAMVPAARLKGTRPDLGRVVEAGLGAIVEYELLRRHGRPDLPSLVAHSRSPIVGRVNDLLSNEAVAPSSPSLQPASFEAMRIPVDLATHLGWRAFVTRGDLAARRAGFTASVAEALAGALGELADNVVQHSQAPELGLAAFSYGEGRFEYVVADSGIGMLASLRQAKEFRSLRDDMEALPLAVMQGISRFGRGSGHGYGYRAVFLPLRAITGAVRLRSGSAVLEIAGKGSKEDHGLCSQRPTYTGVTISGIFSR